MAPCSKCSKKYNAVCFIMQLVNGFTVEAYCCSVLACQQRFISECAGNSYQGNQSCIKDDEEVRSHIIGKY